MAKVHPDDRSQCDAIGMTPENPTARVRYRIVRSDGSLLWVEKTARAFFDGAAYRLHWALSRPRMIPAQRSTERDCQVRLRPKWIFFQAEPKYDHSQLPSRCRARFPYDKSSIFHRVTTHRNTHG
jgi:hypothetical protein